MSASLKTRLKKLEAHLGANGNKYPVIVMGENNRDDDEIIGIGCNGKSTERQSAETVEGLIARGGRELREKILFLTYVGGDHGDTCVFWPKVL